MVWIILCVFVLCLCLWCCFISCLASEKSHSLVLLHTEMSLSLLATALYIFATAVAAFGTTENNLSIEEWKILKKEYFLQQFMEQLEKEPRKVIARSTEAELPKKLQEIDIKSEEKRNSRSPTVLNQCPSDSSQDPEYPCCTDSVEIDFHSLGWTFVLSPRTIQYKFCRGSCNPEFVRPNLFTKAAAQILYVSNFSALKSSKIHLTYHQIVITNHT